MSTVRSIDHRPERWPRESSRGHRAVGLVHILSDGPPVGIGMVLTPSGKVLTP
jgi:hypothetical protein